MDEANISANPWNTKSHTSINPLHSRPLDVHVYSEHSEVGRIVRHIWQKSCQDLACANPKRGGIKPKASYQNQLRVLILDLYVAWQTDPDLSIGVHLSNTAWNTNSRYNALHLSRKIPGLVHRLADHGFIHLSKGSYAGPGAKTNRTARIIAAEPLKKLFREAKFRREHIYAFPGKECIIMHNSKGKESEYEDTEEIKRMRNDLVAYNRLLARTFIDIPDQQRPFIERPIKSGPRQGEAARVSICTMDNHVRRIFNRNEWCCGGRFFGGWWQSVGSEFRKRIHINDEPTVEVDYQALHVAILSAKHGFKLTGDPYELENGLVEGYSAAEQRKLIKVLVLMALNAKDRQTACKAFRQGSSTGSRAKSMTNVELFRLLDAFVAKHPYLADDLCSDQGIRLMCLDSQIASRIINYFTRRDIPILCVHDSFLINYRLARKLKIVMDAVARSMIGCPISLSNNYFGLDEVERQSPDLVEDYMLMRRRDRCPEYLIRKRLFSERVSYLGLGG